MHAPHVATRQLYVPGSGGGVFACSAHPQPGHCRGERRARLCGRASTCNNTRDPNDDFALFQSQVESELRFKDLEKWVKKHVGITYVRLDPAYDSCNFNMDWDEYIWSSQKEK